ncbi:hypothetical protein IWZ03DRAFT_11338 [Phyllosticta citriasiana]|uniref:Uncharacterized protein n=1 Tax=Phyllosticta citriasiana TaxID=595635 RepID=A0ABR1L2E6_9PEZI
MIFQAESSLADMINYLDKSEGELEELFEDMYDEILEEDREEGLVYIKMLELTFGTASTVTFLAYGSYPTLSERLAPTQHFSEKLGELTEEKLRTLEHRKKIRLEKCCGQFVELDGEKVDVVHQTVVEFFSSDRFHQRNATSMKGTEAKRNIYAAAAVIMQLWNPHLEVLQNSYLDRQEWVFGMIKYGVHVLYLLIKEGTSTNLVTPFVNAASSSQLLSWACRISSPMYKAIYRQRPRGQPFADLCHGALHEILHGLGSSLPKVPKPSLRPTIEAMFGVVAANRDLSIFIRRTAAESIERIVANSISLCSRKRPNSTSQGLSTWQHCLVALVFFKRVYGRCSSDQDGNNFLARVNWQPDELTALLIRAGADPYASIKIYPFASPEWSGAQPFWAIRHYIEQQSLEDFDEALLDRRQLSALEVLEMVFGRGRKATVLLRGKAASKSTSAFPGSWLSRFGGTSTRRRDDDAGRLERGVQTANEHGGRKFLRRLFQ